MKNLLFFMTAMIVMAAVSVQAEAVAETDAETVDSRTIVKKQDKRGINNLGYGYGSSGLGYDTLGLGYSDSLSGGYLAPAVSLSKVNYVNGGGLGGFGGYPGYTGGNALYSGIGRLNPNLGYGYNRGYGGYNTGYTGYPGYNNFGGYTGGYSGGYSQYPYSRVVGLGGYSSPVSTSYAQNGGYYY